MSLRVKKTICIRSNLRSRYFNIKYITCQIDLTLILYSLSFNLYYIFKCRTSCEVFLFFTKEGEFMQENNLHDLRHSCATLLVQNKVPIKDIQI